MSINTLEQALLKIEELEAEKAQLRKDLEHYRNRKVSGRKKHDSKWMESFNNFSMLYESGMSIMEIVDNSSFSRRTAYRYKAYYDELSKKKNAK